MDKILEVIIVQDQTTGAPEEYCVIYSLTLSDSTVRHESFCVMAEDAANEAAAIVLTNAMALERKTALNAAIALPFDAVVESVTNVGPVTL